MEPPNVGWVSHIAQDVDLWKHWFHDIAPHCFFCSGPIPAPPVEFGAQLNLVEFYSQVQKQRLLLIAASFTNADLRIRAPSKKFK